MTYLDYSATTMVDTDVLDTFVNVTKKYIANPNSLHKLGVEAKNIIDAATEQIADLLNIKPSEIIYTSGASEANNTAIKGVCSKYKNRGKHIITTSFEHSSIYGPLNSLQKEGFIVDIVDTNSFGIVDINSLKKLLTDDTILVSIGLINSEIGIIQPINEIGKLLKNYPKCIFHVDMTQGLGKIDIDFTNVDLASFTAHKIYGIKGIGALYKKEGISFAPLINGGKSTTIYRSGTPSPALIASFSKAIRLILKDRNSKYEIVKKLNEKLKQELLLIDDIYINSNNYCIPHILNVSVLGVKPETLQHALEDYEIYISTQTACSTSKESRSVYALTNDMNKALSSIRISLSHLTTTGDIDYFIKCLKECLEKLRGVSNAKNR